jgi:hypothetical protein
VLRGRYLDCFRHRKEFYINTIVLALGEERSTVLPIFHSFTSCDTISAFLDKGKLSAWDAWKCYPAVTEAFTFITENPFIAMEVSNHNLK